MLRLPYLWPVGASGTWLLRPFDATPVAFVPLLSSVTSVPGSSYTFPAQTWNKTFLLATPLVGNDI